MYKRSRVLRLTYTSLFGFWACQDELYFWSKNIYPVQIPPLYFGEMSFVLCSQAHGWRKFSQDESCLQSRPYLIYVRLWTLDFWVPAEAN